MHAWKQQVIHSYKIMRIWSIFNFQPLLSNQISILSIICLELVCLISKSVISCDLRVIMSGTKKKFLSENMRSIHWLKWSNDRFSMVYGTLLLFSTFIEIMSNLFKQFFMRCIPNSIIVLVIYFIVAHRINNHTCYILTTPLQVSIFLLPWHEKFDNSNCNCAVRARTQKCLRRLYTQLSW